MKAVAILVLLLINQITFAKQANPDSIRLAEHIAASLNRVNTSEDVRLSNTKVEYDNFLLQHRMKAYKWQLLSAQIIFSVANLIVLIGIYLSYLQFKLSHRNRKVQTEIENGEQLTTKLEISKDGIKIDSAVIGLIILIISLAFYFLYLNYAFSINDPSR